MSLKQWIFCPRPNPQAQWRLVCFAHAGGGAATFRTWPQHLPPNVEVWAVRLPGRESRMAEPSFTALEPMLDALTEVLQPNLRPPFALFGHSMGAFISFELARRWRRDLLPGPSHLFVAGRHAPHLNSPNAPLHHLPDAEFLVKVQEYGGVPEVILNEPELLALMLPIMRADFTIIDTYTYTPEPPLVCPISAFGGRDDVKAPPNMLEAWRVHTTGRFSLRMYPGGHFFLKDVEAALLQAIGDDLSNI